MGGVLIGTQALNIGAIERNLQITGYNPREPFNGLPRLPRLPRLPPVAEAQSRAILKACMQPRATLAQLKAAGRQIRPALPNARPHPSTSSS